MFVMSIWCKRARYVPLYVTRYGVNTLDMFCKQNSILLPLQIFSVGHQWWFSGGKYFCCCMLSMSIWRKCARYVPLCVTRYGANALDMICKQNFILLPLQIFSVAVLFLFYFRHGFASNCVVFGNE